MDTLFSRHRNLIVLIAVLLAQLIMLAYQVRRPDSDVPLIREWVSLVVTPPQRLVSGTLRTVGTTWSNYIDLRGARRETVSLEDQLNQARIENHALRDQIGEMQRFQALAGYAETSPSKTIAARIIGTGASDQSRVIMLDKGKEDGVRANMAVITADGIVGKVQRVFEGSSQVLMITDEESGVGALLETTRIHGVLRGQNTATVQLRYVLNDEKVNVGDRILTSGEDRVFPKGLPVGTVSQVEPGPDFKKITVQPAARLNRLEEVLVVVQGREVAMPPLKFDPSASVIAAAAKPAPAVGAEDAAANPEALAVSTAAAASAAGAATGGATPGTQPARGAHPETDADKIFDVYRAKAAAGGKKAPAGATGGTGAVVRKPAASGGAGATGSTGVVRKPATVPPQ